MSIAKKINLKDDEKIVSVVGPHLLAYIWKYLLGLALLFVFSFFMFTLFSYGLWGDMIYGLGMFLGIYIILHTWLMNHSNVLVVTSDRVVDIHRLGWFDEIISSVSYLDIKDVAVRKKGIAQSLFNFGGIAIATKSQQFVLEILNISNPAKHQLLLADISQQYKQDIKIANMQVIYNNFIKIIPDLTDGDLAEVKTLIDEQLGSDVV
ncbi:MAG: Uncharacterized protein G01um101413_683 [Parcubacteria group bacterium Gr01-1014_13]|nr:MAG: Uncharacterized protein G01um101413_683 [Parcubacteria group bacterium Gr01-1014_13]